MLVLPVHGRQSHFVVSEFFILRENTPVPASSDEYEQWIESVPPGELILEESVVRTGAGEVKIRTRFLGINQQKDENGTPEPYETILIGSVPPGLAGRIFSYPTDEAARSGHALRVQEAGR